MQFFHRHALIAAACAIRAGMLPVAAAPITVTGIPQGQANRMLEQLSGRLEYVRTRPATLWRARDAAWLMAWALRNNGYRDAEVAHAVAGGTIVLTVRSGIRYSLAGVTVTGVGKADAKRLAGLFAMPAREKQALLGGPGPWIEGNTKRAMELVNADFHSRGYWAAFVEIAGDPLDAASGAFTFHLTASPGPLFTISPAEFSGNLADKQSALHAIAAGFTGKSADTTNLNNLRAAVEAVFAKDGYQFATVAYSHRLESATLVPVLAIEARQRYRLGAITLIGLERTRAARVRALYDGVDRSVYNPEALNAIERLLMQTGAFSSVRRELVMRDDGAIDVETRFAEGRARGFATMLGAGSYEGMIAGLSYYDRNAGGTLGGYSFGGEWSSRSLLGALRWTQPVFPTAADTISASVFALSRDHEGYENLQLGGETGFSRKFGKHAVATITARGANNETSAAGLPDDVLGPASYQDASLRVDGALNHFDSHSNPRDGWLAKAWLEGGQLSGSGAYTEGGAEVIWITPLGNHKWVSARGRVEAIELAGGGELPVDKRLFNGGVDSVRGFPERELGPLANGYPLGGQGAWSMSVEHQHRLAGPLKSVLFYDAGGLADGVNPFDGRIEHSVGLGLRVDLPIGPLRFEYGYNLDRDEGEPAGAFHFAIGIEF